MKENFKSMYLKEVITMEAIKSGELVNVIEHLNDYEEITAPSNFWIGIGIGVGIGIALT